MGGGSSVPRIDDVVAAQLQWEQENAESRRRWDLMIAEAQQEMGPSPARALERGHEAFIEAEQERQLVLTDLWRWRAVQVSWEQHDKRAPPRHRLQSKSQAMDLLKLGHRQQFPPQNTPEGRLARQTDPS